MSFHLSSSLMASAAGASELLEAGAGAAELGAAESGLDAGAGEAL
jgi:hypothetical protein